MSSRYVDGVEPPIVLSSARRHVIADDDMLHAHRHPLRDFALDDGLVMVIDPDRTGRPLEIGLALADSLTIIVHAMPARARFPR